MVRIIQINAQNEEVTKDHPHHLLDIQMPSAARLDTWHLLRNEILDNRTVEAIGMKHSTGYQVA